jgi:hypothetical protein
MLTALDEVERLLVTPENPPRDDLDGMDFERAAALHNAIVKHALIASGRAELLPSQTTWWDHDSSLRDDLAARLHPSVIEFWKLALCIHSPATELNFFHYLTTFADCAEWMEEENYLHFYNTDQTHATKVLGMMYGWHSHLATSRQLD